MNCSYVVFSGSFCCLNVLCVNAFSVLILQVALALISFTCYVHVMCVKRDVKNGQVFHEQKWLIELCDVWVNVQFMFVCCEKSCG